MTLNFFPEKVWVIQNRVIDAAEVAIGAKNVQEYGTNVVSVKEVSNGF